MNISEIKRVAIYPPIGIARIGNSPDEFFMGPTIPGQPVSDGDDFRDRKGRIKRQAVRFYVYALDKDGKIIGQLSGKGGVKIDWSVEVANKKAGWYNFDLALDIPAAQGEFDTNGVASPGGPAILSTRRNPGFQGEDRELLMIQGGTQKISGRNKNKQGKTHHFVGKIGRAQKPVYLGEVRTDEEGHLIFLGGLGKSDSFDGSPLTTFANNQGWHDDTSDGTVDALVTLPDGRMLEAEGAWVLTAPPNYAVGVEAITTGYDLLSDVLYRENPGKHLDEPAFFSEIYPTLKHFGRNQWVNAGMSRDFGWGSAYDFEDGKVLARLMDQSDANRPFRQTIFDSFRNPDFKEAEADAWPPVYGDGVAFNVEATDPRNWYAVTKLQFDRLEMWARGKFRCDEPRERLCWTEMTPAEQAAGLTEAALEETLGGPFHPGCEFTWPMRHGIMFENGKPFRIARRSDTKEDYGVAINHEIALAKGGPLDGSSPGDITKWMAVPWQTDTSSCLSGYRSFSGEYLPTFWPARVPNDVLTEESYEYLQGKGSKEKKITAFGPGSRKKWLRGFIYDEDGQPLPDRMSAGITKFTKYWHEAGIVLKKPLDANPDLFPGKVWVETGRRFKLKTTAAKSGDEKPAEWVSENPRKYR